MLYRKQSALSSQAQESSARAPTHRSLVRRTGCPKRLREPAAAPPRRNSRPPSTFRPMAMLYFETPRSPVECSLGSARRTRSDSICFATLPARTLVAGLSTPVKRDRLLGATSANASKRISPRSSSFRAHESAFSLRAASKWNNTVEHPISSPSQPHSNESNSRSTRAVVA